MNVFLQLFEIKRALKCRYVSK